jgi:hypothetical protein
MYDNFAYNAMGYFEFANDIYATASVLHRFNGFFLNKVPLLRKLKWRELVGAKAIFGSVSNKHNDAMLIPEGLKSLENDPYYEANIGIENIFKIFRVDAVWRLSHLDVPDAEPIRIKMSMQFLF